MKSEIKAVIALTENRRLVLDAAGRILSEQLGTALSRVQVVSVLASQYVLQNRKPKKKPLDK